MDEMERAAGIDTSSPDYRLRRLLAESDDEFMEKLVLARKGNGLSRLEVAARMKVDESVVSDFERIGSDPNLSTIRRYAAAVGVEITHKVKF